MSDIELSVDSSKVNKKACIKENVLYIQVFNAGVTFTRERSEDVCDTYVSFTFEICHLTKIIYWSV